LKEEIRGIVALEVMLVDSKDGRITNTRGKCLRNLIDAIVNANTDQIQLEVPYRPPSERFVQPPSKKRMEQIYNELSMLFGKDKLWVYGFHDKRGKRVIWLGHESLENEIIEMLKRRPCRVVDVSSSLGIDVSTAESLLRKLKRRHSIITRTVEDEKYFSVLNSK
jgi:wyosine [tRNA(Phe)-imidazoG37] synthetase (radical SAM superfamily)